MFRWLIVVFLSLWLASCASVPMESPQKDQQLKSFSAPQGKAGLYMYRPYAYVGSGVSNDLLIDGDKVGELAINTYLYIEVPPGRHVIAAEYQGAYGSSIPVDAVGGQLYFISATAGFAGMQVKLENSQDGKAGVMECALAQSTLLGNATKQPSLIGTMSTGLSGNNPGSLGGSAAAAAAPAAVQVAPPSAQPVSVSSVSLQTSSPALSEGDMAHFKSTLANGKPAQLYFLATEMGNAGHQDLALQLYQRLVDKYPDDVYTAKAIEKMDHGFQPVAGRVTPTSGGGTGFSPQQLAHAKEAHDACQALCESQSRECNGQALGSAASSAMGYVSSVISGDAMGMLSNLGGAVVGAAKDCDTPLRACIAACPIDPTASNSPAPAAPVTSGAMK